MELFNQEQFSETLVYSTKPTTLPAEGGISISIQKGGLGWALLYPLKISLAMFKSIMGSGWTSILVGLFLEKLQRVRYIGETILIPAAVLKMATNTYHLSASPIGDSSNLWLARLWVCISYRGLQ